MTKATEASMNRVKTLLTKQMNEGFQKGILSVYKVELIQKQINLLNENLPEEQTARILREINKHMRLDIYSIFRHATGQVN